MLQEVIVTNELDETLTLKMYQPAESGFYIKSIKGLGPSKANVNIIDIVSYDGGLYNSARCDKRNIVFELGAWDTVADVERLRQTSYRYFPIKGKIRMQFNTDNRKVNIIGYVESNEPNIWSENVTMSISVICPDPYFKDIYENSITYTNDGELHTINYEGDSDAGVTIQLNCGSDVTGLSIQNTNGQAFTVVDNYLAKKAPNKILANDIIILDTIPNEKGIKLTRGETTYNILNAMNRSSVWFKINRFKRSFKVLAATGQNDIIVTISSPILYEGI